MDLSYAAPRRDVVVLARAGGAETLAAVALAGWHVVSSAAPAEARAALAQQPPGGLVVLDVAGEPEEMLHATVAGVAAAAHEAGAPLVIVASTAQIDLVVDAAPEGTALLCEPEPADWPVMLALAAQSRGAPGVREDDQERIARLNAEVARIAELVAALTRESGGRAADRTQAFAPAPDGPVPSAAEVRGVIRARRLRERFFAPGLFADPAWDMLLDLFAAELEGARVSVSSLCIAAAVPPTTALRWITTLTGAGLLARAPDPEDRRRAFLSLSAEGSAGMRRYAAAVRDGGLPLV